MAKGIQGSDGDFHCHPRIGLLSCLCAGCKAGLVFVTAFETCRTMQTFVSHIAQESEVWIAEDPDHMIHFNVQRFLGPYPDVMPK